MLMNQPRRSSALVTLAVVVIAVGLVAGVGCGKNKVESAYGPGADWIEDLRERITKDIADEDKAIKLLEQVDRIEAFLADLDHTLLEYYEKIGLLDADYNSTRDDFQKEIDSFNDYRHIKFEELIGIVMEMKKIAGRADWEIVSDMDQTLYESWQRSYGQ